jgi:predicted dehydrogenase
MEKARIGVVGLGTVAQLVHLPNLSKINNAEIAAVSEIKSSRLNAVAEKFNVKNKFRDHNEMLEKSELDAVIIATPTSTHKDIALDCIKAGKDMLIEKPMARNYVEAKQIVDAAKKANVKLMVGMNLRFRPDLMLLRSLIEQRGNRNSILCKGWMDSSAEQHTKVVYKKRRIRRRSNNRFRNSSY